MARLLQNMMPIAALLIGGCIISPPIEPRDEPNLAPRIRPVLPDQKDPVVRVTRETFTGDILLRAELLDGNHEEELSYLFVSDERGDPFQSGAPFEEEKGGEFAYGQVDYSVSPCTGDVTIPGTEVITLYVSDRGFDSTSPDPAEIVEAHGAIMVAYSWTLIYEAGICDTQL